VPFNTAHTINFAVIKRTAEDQVMFARLGAVVNQRVVDQMEVHALIAFVVDPLEMGA